MSTGVERIAAERQRQVEVEGYTPAHDADHDPGVLALAGACYARFAHLQLDSLEAEGTLRILRDKVEDEYPWHGSEGFNPSEDPRRNLEKAGALIAAELDRMGGR